MNKSKNIVPEYEFIPFLKKRAEFLKKEIATRKKRLKSAPAGSLRIVKKKHCSQYYLGGKNNIKGTYISKSEMPLIRALAQKKYDKKYVSAAEAELKGIQKFINSNPGKTATIVSSFPGELRDTLDYAEMTVKDYYETWQALPFTAKKNHENITLHLTRRGEHVRSKSEELIANALFRHGIPYKYECPVSLFNGEIRHPDFTILHPHAGNVVYWEHLGMLDKPQYVEDNILKFRDYEKSGIQLGKNLLVTYENSKSPLNSMIVENFIKAHFS
ncbi:hypothetical protein [Butyrivibrio sp. AD3002]|uniref:hypothetical protein n=1 Tax=Butyrivibrio sp. AD3002 TaxID=1280670 RepID=UPI0003B4A0C3|nr:hypothetical protein [Butyrivibrio sp. AD3002]